MQRSLLADGTHLCVPCGGSGPEGVGPHEGRRRIREAPIFLLVSAVTDVSFWIFADNCPWQLLLALVTCSPSPSQMSLHRRCGVSVPLPTCLFVL